MDKKEPLGKSLPIGCVLTIAAAGSETSGSAVLTNEEIGKKCGISTELNRPKFAIMNPELTYTLPKYQIACGITDICSRCNPCSGLGSMGEIFIHV